MYPVSPTRTERPYPLGERTIRANVKSIDPQGPVEDGGSPLDASPVNLTREEKEEHERASKMQLWWHHHIAKHMNLPEGYSRVAVLLIRWHDDLDDLNTRGETQELRDLFEDRFRFETQIAELNGNSKPQHQLQRHLSNFIDKYDGPNHLLIVYYTGHGVFREQTQSLELWATTKEEATGRKAIARWDTAEESLRSPDLDADVLAILDSCYASNLRKSGSEETRTYELISACGFDQTTAGPGPTSFTRALIDSLKCLLAENQHRTFDTFQLNSQICKSEARKTTPSLLWSRLRHYRHITLAPLKLEDKKLQEALLKRQPRGYLTLRFALRDDRLNEEQIEFLASRVAKGFKSHYLVHQIEWMGIQPAKTPHFKPMAYAVYAISQWKKFLNKKKEEKSASQEKDDPMVEPEATPSSPARKRSRSEMDTELGGFPLPKRGVLVPSSLKEGPPSPPTSDSS